MRVDYPPRNPETQSKVPAVLVVEPAEPEFVLASQNFQLIGVADENPARRFALIFPASLFNVQRATEGDLSPKRRRDQRERFFQPEDVRLYDSARIAG